MTELLKLREFSRRDCGKRGSECKVWPEGWTNSETLRRAGAATAARTTCPTVTLISSLCHASVTFRV
jgi:hypothetical protein